MIKYQKTLIGLFKSNLLYCPNLHKAVINWLENFINLPPSKYPYYYTTFFTLTNTFAVESSILKFVTHFKFSNFAQLPTVNKSNISVLIVNFLINSFNFLSEFSCFFQELLVYFSCFLYFIFKILFLFYVPIFISLYF
mgnify:CR=1 FL=1